jgi:outer membrane protein assembly factor BamB
MLQYFYKEFTIEIFDDPTYTFKSADNNHTYLKHYFSEDEHQYNISKHGIKIYKNEKEINSCIVLASGGTTGIYENSLIVDNGKIVICCCDTIFCFSLPDLELIWKTRADTATCLEIFKFENDYLVHGECEITRIDQEGKIIWQFGGMDIFITFKGYNDLIILNDCLLLTDWNYAEYKIDFDGNLINSVFKKI